jgi:flagellar protein FliO/FliZ
MRCLWIGLFELAPTPDPPPDSPTLHTAAQQTLWALLVVVGLILALYALARKRWLFGLGKSGGNAITVIEMRPLLPKTTLALVEVRGREYLLGISSGGIELLADLSQPPDPGRPDFASLLAEGQ